MTLRAYAVTEHAENTGAIVFARHAIAARKAGAEEFAGGDIGGVSCCRAPWADRFAGRPVPARVMIDAGWHFECAGCDLRIDTDMLADRRLPLDGVIGSQHSLVFCGSRCARRCLSRRRRREAQQKLAIETFKAVVRRRFPDVVFTDDHANMFFRSHAYAYFVHGGPGWHWQEVRVVFAFPGMVVGPASFAIADRSRGRWGSSLIGPVRAEYGCCAGDRGAFEAYAAATRGRA